MFNGRVLIIDDSQADAELCQLNLSSSDFPKFDITHAENASHGLQLAQQLRPDCILLDYVLPDMSGIEFLRRYGETDDPAAVVMMSGEGSEQVAVSAMKLCADDYFPKRDLDSLDLGERVHNAITRKALDRVQQRGFRQLLSFSNAVCNATVGPLQEAAECAARLGAHRKTGSRLRQSPDFATLERAIALALRTSEQLRNLDCADGPRLGCAMAECDLNDILQDALFAESRRIEAAAAQVRADTLPIEFVDPAAMAVLFGNLIANAVASGRPGDDEGALEIEISLEEAARFWKIGVTDNGDGMVPRDRVRAFDPFVSGVPRGDEVRAGLGLTVCRSIVERHGGTIWVDPGFGRGTTVYFTLPKRSAT